MRQKEFQALIRKYLLPHLPNFEVKGDLLFIKPIKYLLRGFCFQSSTFDRFSFNVQTFVQPLYIPLEHIAFFTGFRLGQHIGQGGHWWKISKENAKEIMAEILGLIQIEGLPFLQGLENPFHLTVEIRNKFLSDDYPASFWNEILAFSLILSDKYEEALQELNRLIYLLSEKEKLEEWHKARLERATRLRDLLKAHKEQAALALLEQWRAYTIGKLRLEKFVEG